MNVPIALTITVEQSVGGWGHDVYLNGQFAGHRPYDGARPEEICTEVSTALAELIRKQLDWKPFTDDSDELDDS